MHGHKATDPRVKLACGRSRRNGKIEPINFTGLDEAACPNQRRFGLSASGRGLNDRKPFVQWQRESSELSRSRVTTFEEIVSRRAAVPTGPSRASENVGCKLVNFARRKRKSRRHPIRCHEDARKQMLPGWRETQLSCRFCCVWKLGDQELAQFSDLRNWVVTVSGSSEKLFEDRQMQADSIIRDRLTVMTD